MTGTATAPTWAAMTEIEPQLRDLERDARRLSQSTRKTSYWTTWESLKRRLLDLAGWHANNPKLQSAAAFELVYHTIYQAYQNGTKATERDA